MKPEIEKTEITDLKEFSIKSGKFPASKCSTCQGCGCVGNCGGKCSQCGLEKIKIK